MKFLIIGLGSMGKRRIRNLLSLGVKNKDIFGFDLSAEACSNIKRQFGVLTYANFKIADRINPDAYIISTPPHLHAEYFLSAAKKGKHFFVEVATTDHGYAKLKLLLDNSFIAAPSFTFRYFEPVKKIKKMLEQNKIGKVLAFNHHLGQYLPDWHPWQDYREFYVSQKKSSACKEMVLYELQWIQWILGEKFTRAKGTTTKVSALDMKIDDVCSAILRSKNIVGTLMVDLIARPAVRLFRVLGSKGTLEWDWQKYQIRIYKAKSKRWSITNLKRGKKIKGYQTTTEEMYRAELADFLGAIRGQRKYPYSFDQDQLNFKLLKKIEKK